MKLGYNTNGFASHRLQEALEIIAELGFKSVAITLDHHALDPYSEWRRSAGEVAARLRDLQMEVVVETGARFLLDARRKHRPTLMDVDASDRDTRVDFLLRAAEVGEAIGARVLSLWSGCRAPGETAAQAELDERLALGLRRVCEAAAARGQAVALEPEPGMYVEGMVDFDRIVNLLGAESLSLTLDLGHALITEGDVDATVRRYISHVRNVHVEGMRRDLHEHLVPWEGDFDVRGALRLLCELGYRGPATLELSRHSHDAVEVATRAYSFLSASS